MRFLAVIISLGAGILCMACDDNRVFEKYHGMKTGSWNIADTVSFELPLLNSLPTKAVVAIKYTNDYEYRNLYLTYFLKDSLNQVIETDLFDVPLFDNKSGKPLGSGFGNSYTQYDTLNIQINAGVSKIQLLQYMRVDEIQGIEAIGVKIVKAID